MNESKTESKINISLRRRMFLFAIVAIILGFSGFLISGHGLAGYVFAHAGGLGILGLFGSLSGHLARKKGYGYWPAYFWGFAFPAIIGIISVVVVHSLGGGGCGGIVSLAAGIVIVIFYYCLKNREIH
jgi:hypothetical protein